MKCPTAEDRQHAFDQEHSWSIRALLPAIDWHALWADEEEEEWLLYPLIPARRLIALFSAAKTGKSLLMLEIAAALSTGRKVLGHDPGRRIRVLYVDFENDPRGDVRTRLQDMGYEPGQLDHLDYLSFPSLPYLDSDAGASALIAAVETYRPELVVIDTISRAVGGEENDNDTWLNLYKHTGLALKRAQVAMIRLDHTGKDEAKGQRGGSAKSGDVDAIWKLATVVKDERYRLECLDSRFSLETKELTLSRLDDPLHHDVMDKGAGGGDREAKIQQLIKYADQDDVSRDIGRPKLAEWAKDRGLKARNDVLSEVIKRRKNTGSLVFDTSGPIGPQVTENLSPTSGTGQNPGTVPSNGDSNGTKINTERKKLSPSNGDRPGQVASAHLSPSLSLYKRDGKGQVPGQACEECGWDRFHKAACSKNPNQLKEEEDA